MTTTVSLQISLESLIAAVSALSSKDKRTVLDILDQQIFEEEEADYEEDSETAAEVAASKAEIAAGEYTTFDDYLSSHVSKPSNQAS